MAISDNNLMILKNEVIMAEKLNEDQIEPIMRDAINRYTNWNTSHYSHLNLDIILNEIYPIVQQELPAIFFRNPRAFLKPRNKTFIVKRRNPLTGKMEDVVLESMKSARTQEHILNYTIEQIKYKDEARKVLQDALMFRHGIMWHGYKGEFGMTEEQSLVIENEQIFVKRIPPHRFIFDPKVSLSNLDEAEWIGRSFDVLLRDIIEDDKLKVDKMLKGKKGFGVVLDKDNPSVQSAGKGVDKLALRRRAKVKTLLDYTDNEFGNHAQFIKVYEIFRIPTKKEKRKGDKGQVILFTDEQKKPLRENPWPYKIKGWPVEILEFNYVPDQRFGMSDLEVYGPIAENKNILRNLQLRNAEANSKVMVFYDKNGMDETDIQKIEDGQQLIIGLEGAVNNKVSLISPGGNASNELYMADQRIQNDLDEKSGVTDLKKGISRSGEESATSIRIRSAGAASRPAYRQDMMSDFLQRSFKTINDLNQQFMPVKDAVRIMGTLDIEWSDNPTKEEIQADVDVTIDAISMLPEDPQRELQENQLLLTMMTEAMNNPAIMAKLQQEGKMFNVSPVIEQLLLRLKIRNPEIFRNIRPEESQGYASVSELRAAEANVQAAIAGQQLPSPPAEGQQHMTRVGVYNSARQILQMQGQMNEILDQLLMVQAQLAEQESDKQAPRTPSKLKKPKVETT